VFKRTRVVDNEVGDVDLSSIRQLRLHSPLNLRALHRQNQGGVLIPPQPIGETNRRIFSILRTRDNHQFIESIADAASNNERGLNHCDSFWFAPTDFCHPLFLSFDHCGVDDLIQLRDSSAAKCGIG